MQTCLTQFDAHVSPIYLFFHLNHQDTIEHDQKYANSVNVLYGPIANRHTFEQIFFC